MNNPTTLHGATDAEIRDHYDARPDLTLVELARRAGKTVAALKKILMP